MKFCEKCGSYMQGTVSGFICSKCGHRLQTENVDVVKMNTQPNVTVDVLDASKLEYNKVAKTCPQCGNGEAFHSLGLVTGEHAGVRQERSMERFTCTKCGHSWND